MRGYTMEATWLIVTALTACGVAAVPPQEEASETLSNAHVARASCVVRIDSDPALLPIDGEVIEQLLDSTPVSGEAALKVFGSESERQPENVMTMFEELSVSASDAGHTLVGALRVTVVNAPEGVSAAAPEFLAEVCQRLERALAAVGEVDETRVRARLADVDQELSLVHRRFEELRALEEELREQAGRADLARHRIDATSHDLGKTRASLELKLAGAKAREAALVEQIAKIGRDIDKSLKESAVAAELQKVVEIREKEVVRVQQLVQRGVASSHDLDQPQEDLAHARAALAQYRESASEKVGGGLLAELNKQLVEVAIESAENEAELRGVEAQLSEIRGRKLLQLADRYEREVQLQLRFAEHALQELTAEQEALKRQLRSLRRPKVIVIGGV
jgi:hypothetical protein